jgi:iron complex outermembrane receptor protein
MANTNITRAVRYALIVAGASAATLPAPAAFAQQEAEIEQVVVTGSRIRLRDFEEISPVATVGADTIQATGAVSVEQVLNALPQVVPGFTATSNNPADGTATVDLRGLGPTRTLVLVNGRRLTPSTNDGRTDLNNVPTQLVQRIEVVTGGASAVYGSDALAGVVNFILKDNFEGFEASYQHGATTRGEGSDDLITVTLGGNFADDKGNMTAYASYNQRDSILQSERRYTRVNRDGGSSTGIAGRIDNSGLNPFDFALDPDVTPRRGNQAFNQDGSIRPFVNAMPETNGGVGDRYNFAPVNYLLTPADKWTVGALGHFEFNEYADVYTELLFVNSNTATQLAPTPATGILVGLDSPFLDQSVLDLAATREDPTAPLTIRRRMVEMGARQAETQSNLFQMNVGVKGSIGFKDWEYDAYYSFGRNEFDTYTRNDVSRSKFQAGIAGCPADYIRFVPSCVGVNPFGAGNISQEAADFIRLNFGDSQVFERNMASAIINGTLFDLPAGGVGFALGTEFRKDQTDYTPDVSKQSGDILGFNAQQPISGDYDVMEYYVEVAVPLLKDVPGFESLGLELGARLSDYSSVGNVSAYKAGLNWQVIDSLRLRGMYQRAVRAPSVFELFQAGDQGFPQYSDPCAGADDPAIVAFCAEQGIADTASFEQTNTQVETFFFGNPDLSEETSDTYTFGLVFQPNFVKNFSVSLDYYDIKVSDYVNTLGGGAQGIINGCFDSLDLQSDACFFAPLNAPLIFRSETGELKVNAPIANLSELETKGLDIQMNYAIPVWNTINLSLLATYLDSWVLDGIDYVGTTGAYNISGSFPEWKAYLRAGVPIGPVTVNYGLQFVDSMDNQGNIPVFEDGGYKGSDSYVTHDLSATWEMTSHLELTVGVNNLTDEEPEQIDLGVDMNTDPGTFDVLGTYWFANIRAKF